MKVLVEGGTVEGGKVEMYGGGDGGWSVEVVPGQV